MLAPQAAQKAIQQTNADAEWQAQPHLLATVIKHLHWNLATEDDLLVQDSFIELLRCLRKRAHRWGQGMNVVLKDAG